MIRFIRIGLLVVACSFLGSSVSFGATKTAESDGIRATVEYPGRVVQGDKLWFVLMFESNQPVGRGLQVDFGLPSDELFGQFLASEIVSPGGVVLPESGSKVIRFDDISTINATPNKIYHFKFGVSDLVVDSPSVNIDITAEVEIVADRNQTILRVGVTSAAVLIAIWFAARRFIANRVST